MSDSINVDNEPTLGTMYFVPMSRELVTLVPVSPDELEVPPNDVAVDESREKDERSVPLVEPSTPLFKVLQTLNIDR